MTDVQKAADHGGAAAVQFLSGVVAVPLTLRQVLLLAVADVAMARGDIRASAFTHHVIVAAWQRSPESYALRGYPQFPDARKVVAKIGGSDGIVGIGWAQWVGNDAITLTPRGIEVVNMLRAEPAQDGTA